MPELKRRRWHVYVGWNWWPINRPHVMCHWIDPWHPGVSLSWGNGNSDPVWVIDIMVTLPWRVGRWIDRR